MTLLRTLLVCGALIGVSTSPIQAQSEGAASSREPVERADVFPEAVVAADHPLASQAGIEILEQGGNVVDAAVAVSFALSVVRPESCGLGGGGFMVIWNAETGRSVAIDFRERAPAAATRDMYVSVADRDPSLPPASEKGGLAVAVPGEVAGLCYALEELGTLDRAAVIAPALRLAREGIERDPQMRVGREMTLHQFAEHAEYREQFPGLFELYLDQGAEEVSRFYSPLVPVLEAIAEHGGDGFYRGPIAEAIVAEVHRRGGIISADDLASMRPVVREPLLGRWDGYDVVTMPPPSSGGIALLETLNTLAAYEAAHPQQRLGAGVTHNSVDYVQVVTEALKHAFADRAEYLGDTDFADVPVEWLISPEYARILAERISLETTHPLEAYGRFAPPRDAGTSHFCVIDAQGNAVACTETINTTYGSFVVVPEYGIVLNNEMDDFAARPGEPNAFGLIQSDANAVEPGKKPLSSMTPTILVRDGRAVFAAGASGGPRIISATLQVLLNMTRFGMSPQQAVNAPRFHHQWMPDELLLEGELQEWRGAMESRGHTVTPHNGLAAAQAAARTDDGVSGGSDVRKGGSPAGR